MEIDQEKAREYMEVAALVCMDIEILNDIAINRVLTAEQLVKQIAMTFRKMKRVTTDKTVREARYKAACEIFGLASRKAGGA